MLVARVTTNRSDMEYFCRDRKEIIEILDMLYLVYGDVIHLQMIEVEDVELARLRWPLARRAGGMAVYVDDLHDYGTKGVWCHMWADEEWELEIMRKAIGLKMAWIQLQHKRFIHYDLRPSKRELAVKKGAIYKPLGEWIRATYPKKETDDITL